MSNQQFDEVEALAREMNYDLGVCPTCRHAQVEVVPGIWIWEPSTYKLHGKKHPCECQWQDNLRRHYLLAGIPCDYWTLAGTDFFGDGYAYDAAKEYLDHWVDWKWHGVGIEFYSPVQGTGKTMLATLIAKDLIQRGEGVYFTSFRDAIRLYDMPYAEREAKTKRLRHTPVLVLDEVTSGLSIAQRNFFATELEDLIRFRTANNGVTIVTTNLTLDELDQEYPRTFSLLAGKQQHVRVQGQDARRNGDIDLVRMELITNKEARPLV